MRPSVVCLVMFSLLCVNCSELQIPKLQAFDKASHVNTQIPNDYKTHFFNQTLDHFNFKPESYITFRQKYLINSKYWGGASVKAPIFAFLGGEAPIKRDAVGRGFLAENAPKFKALIVFMEHRFYGDSIPFNMSFEDMLRNGTYNGYFNTAQALADYAAVLLHIKNQLQAIDSPVIVIGGSYGGMLASWFRLKYPHVAVGALASSAPILFSDDTIPRDGYDSTITKDFRDASEECYRTIKGSWLEIDRMGSAPNGLSQLSQMFKTCEPLTSSSELKNHLIYLYTLAAQYNDTPVTTICNAINNGSGILGKIYDGMVAAERNLPCHVNRPKNASQSDLGTFQSRLGWAWLLCTEFVGIEGVSRDDSMFPPQRTSNLTEDMEPCKILFGVLPRPHWVTTYYGGHDIRRVLKRFGSNIIFSNGLKDPWSGGGVVKSISNSILAVTTANGFHCQDIVSSKPSDPDWLVMQRKIELEIIEGWIEKYFADLQASDNY